MTMRLSARELATILTALRHWQEEMADDSESFPEHFADTPRLDADEIDALCERLNRPRNRKSERRAS